MTVKEIGSPNRRDEGSSAGCLALQSGEEVTEYGGSLLSAMRRQLKPSHEEFDGVVTCSIDTEELAGIYSEK